MKITISLTKQDKDLLSDMVREWNGKVTMEDLIHVAIYNLIALWMKDRGKTTH